MKTIKTEIDGREYFLLYNAEAMFQIQELLPEGADLSLLLENTKAALDMAVGTAAVLAEQGELARRSYGYDRGDIPTAELIASCLIPAELVQLKGDIINAVSLGLKQTVKDETNVVDLWLQEIEKKRSADPGAVLPDSTSYKNGHT